MKINLSCKVAMIVIVVVFYSLFIHDTHCYNESKQNMIVYDNDKLIDIIPKGKIYIEDDKYEYVTIGETPEIVQISKEKALIYKLIGQEMFENYRIIGSYIPVVEEIDKNEFPIEYYIEDNSVVIDSKATREKEEYKKFWEENFDDEFVSEIEDNLEKSENEEVFKEYLKIRGIILNDENHFSIGNEEFEYDYTKKVLIKK